MQIPILIILFFFTTINCHDHQKPPIPFGALPSARQLAWHETEVYGLIHFTPTTFENKEWGFGDADPSIFNPRDFDAGQIVSAAKAGGLKGLILVAKHHDGFCLWPTKTNGYYGGKREIRKIDNTVYYDWENTWKNITRKLQPMAAIFSDIGPDVRWVGNEKGIAAEKHWATFNPEAETGSIAVPGNVNTRMSNEGTHRGKYWIPAECDVPLRPGWFYHPEQDGKEKSTDQVFDLYLKSVGRGACLDLGLAPGPNGLLHENDVRILKGFGEKIRTTFKTNFIRGATLTPSNSRGEAYSAKNMQDGDRYTYWSTSDKVHQASIEIGLAEKHEFDLIQLRENIKLGQRIKMAEVEIMEQGGWKVLVSVSTIGANRLIRLDNPIIADRLRITLEAPASLCLSEIGLFKIR